VREAGRGHDFVDRNPGIAVAVEKPPGAFEDLLALAVTEDSVFETARLYARQLILSAEKLDKPAAVGSIATARAEAVIVSNVIGIGLRPPLFCRGHRRTAQEQTIAPTAITPEK
jgi:hypothetical protein